MAPILISFLNEINLICGILRIDTNDSLTGEDISRMYDTLQTELNMPFKENGKVRVSQVISSLSEIFGEIASVSMDLNMQYYGEEDIEDMLSQLDQRIVVYFNIGDYVFLDSEGSQERIETLINSYQ
jgi:uncharacterized protein (UPF0147 family)